MKTGKLQLLFYNRKQSLFEMKKKQNINRVLKSSLLLSALLFTRISFSQEIDFSVLENLLEREFKPLILSSQKYAVSVVSRIPGNSASTTGNVGSGFIVDSDGIVITLKSVIQDYQRSKISVRLNSGESLGSQILGIYDDFAILKVEPFNFENPKFAQINSESTGNWVFVLRNPLGLYRSVSMAFVNATYENGIIRISAKIEPGIFGAPVFNSQGQVVGLLAAKIKLNSIEQGDEIPLEDEGVVIPMGQLFPRIKQIVDQTTSNESWVGLTVSGYPIKNKNTYKITNIFPDSPAEAAGIKLGDEIVAFKGEPISNLEKVKKIIREMNPNDIFGISIKRKNETFNAKIQVGTRTIIYRMDIVPPGMEQDKNELDQALHRFPASRGNLLLLQKRIDQFLRGKFKP